MTATSTCQVLGRWRIVTADLWDRAYLDLTGPAHLQIDNDGHGDFTFGAVTAAMQIEYSQTIVWFRWNGSDEGDQVTGSGSAELHDDGTLEIELSFDNGDDVTLIGRRE